MILSLSVSTTSVLHSTKSGLTFQEPGDCIQSERISDLVFLSIFKVDMRRGVGGGWWWSRSLLSLTAGQRMSSRELQSPFHYSCLGCPLGHWVMVSSHPFPLSGPFFYFLTASAISCTVSLHWTPRACKHLFSFFFFGLRHFADIWMAAISFFFFPPPVHPMCPTVKLVWIFCSTKLPSSCQPWNSADIKKHDSSFQMKFKLYFCQANSLAW